MMMGTVNICAILQYGLEDGVIRLAQQSGHKSSQDIHSRNNSNKMVSRNVNGSNKSAAVAPQAILISHPSSANPPIDSTKQTFSTSSEEGISSAAHASNPTSTLPREEQVDSDVAKLENALDDEPRAIMIRRTAINDNEEDNDPIVFTLAAKFTFEMLKEVLQQNGPEHVCPYLTIVLTFLGSLCHNHRAMKKLERFIPWDRLVFYFNRIPRSIQIRSPFSSLHPEQTQSSTNSSSHLKLVGLPLLEDWCLRGMDWAGRSLVGRGYWKQSKSGGDNNPSSTEPGGQTTKSTSSLLSLSIESELDALVALNGALEAGCRLQGSRPDRTPSMGQGRIDLVDVEAAATNEEFVNGEDGKANKAELVNSIDRWKRIGLVAGWISNFISGLTYHENPSAQTCNRPRFMISQTLRNKILRWEAESKREEEERQLLESRRTTAGRYPHDQIVEFDLEIDERVDEEEEDQDDDDPCDSELVKSLKARRRELKMALNQWKNSSTQETPKQSARKSHAAPQNNPALPGPPKTSSKNLSKLNVLAGYTTLVLDTNILIGMLSIVKDLLESEQYTIIIPLVVITELDGLKKKATDPEPQAQRLGEEALEAIRYLEQSIKSYSRILKIQTSKGNYLRDLSIRNEQINFQDFGTTSSAVASTAAGGSGFITTNAAKNLDDVVLRATSWQLEHFSNRLLPSQIPKASVTSTDRESDHQKFRDPENSNQDDHQNDDEPEKVILLTLDRNLRLKARARGILAADEKQIINLVNPITNHHRQNRNNGGRMNKKSQSTTAQVGTSSEAS